MGLPTSGGGILCGEGGGGGGGTLGKRDRGVRHLYSKNFRNFGLSGLMRAKPCPDREDASSVQDQRKRDGLGEKRRFLHPGDYESITTKWTRGSLAPSSIINLLRTGGLALMVVRLTLTDYCEKTGFLCKSKCGI